ncbi:tRNA (adenosine(37)-N6)-threonylcarbamoyltransferase complex transferase subunit TsaD [Candidatus Xianfuyuplasma coldseepsis]|uniref:tRNA N6-adenosine threonylcarbamoyltransferase n=1 Tax=Candidatus Xianfuyuplasma coldseepsis TaxID=2782163 RepID=A0A7L7KQ19_9MOLU|nr:tRNA (adenosine(37)-N6)-threonylcarbamoyltransferase complex transferase subunit TsaD [Xianfuyuplasma coldseepsis]QMS84891.1 tRNA (adenosine(37)-N6)-threonylcarbamoyltransferase complex transferase subunit TsaD [Xianfuyuplasma coldseepsis]
MIVLSVESSCDETSVSIQRDGKVILSNVVLSQIDVHKQYGGVVPEIASREHIKGITMVFEEALEQAQIPKDDIDLVAVTKGPGLIGSLLVGVNAAKAFAFANQIPLVGVHHIAGHIYSNAIERDLAFPLICLVVSGGHTELILMEEHYDFQKLGETMDDAVGEAYDKVARTVGLGYPGGPIVDQLAIEGQPTYPMPDISMGDTFDFSFSGIKSHVINLVHNIHQRNEEVHVSNLCASFQEAVTDVLVDKSKRAIEQYDAKMFIIAGGVAANKGLRKKIDEQITDVEVVVPQFKYCTDNAAMIGIAGYYQYKKIQKTDDMTLNGASRLRLE